MYNLKAKIYSDETERSKVTRKHYRMISKMTLWRVQNIDSFCNKIAQRCPIFTKILKVAMYCIRHQASRYDCVCKILLDSLRFFGLNLV